MLPSRALVISAAASGRTVDWQTAFGAGNPIEIAAYRL